MAKSVTVCMDGRKGQSAGWREAFAERQRKLNHGATSFKVYFDWFHVTQNILKEVPALFSETVVKQAAPKQAASKKAASKKAASAKAPGRYSHQGMLKPPFWAFCYTPPGRSSPNMLSPGVMRFRAVMFLIATFPAARSLYKVFYPSLPLMGSGIPFLAIEVSIESSRKWFFWLLFAFLAPLLGDQNRKGKKPRLHLFSGDVSIVRTPHRDWHEAVSSPCPLLCPVLLYSPLRPVVPSSPFKTLPCPPQFTR